MLREFFSYALEVLLGWAGALGLITFGLDFVVGAVDTKIGWLERLQSARFLRIVAVLCVFVAQFQLYTASVGANAQDVANARATGEVQRVRLESKAARAEDLLESCQASQSALTAANRELDSRTTSRDQAITIRDASVSDLQKQMQECLLQLSRAKEPPPSKVVFVQLDGLVDAPEGNPKALLGMALTNRDVSPVRAVVGCKGNFKAAHVSVLGAGFVAGSGEMVSPNVYSQTISSPVWTQFSPLLVKLEFGDEDPRPCSFNVQ